MRQLVFLSHASADKELAECLRDVLATDAPELDFFLASVPGQITPGRPWVDDILRRLREADAYVTLLTPVSVQRPWVWFEAGAAWGREKPLALLCAGGLSKSQVKPPLGALQLLSLEEDRVDSLQQVRALLGQPALHDAEACLQRLVALIPASHHRCRAAG